MHPNLYKTTENITVSLRFCHVRRGSKLSSDHKAAQQQINSRWKQIVDISSQSFSSSPTLCEALCTCFTYIWTFVSLLTNNKKIKKERKECHSSESGQWEWQMTLSLTQLSRVLPDLCTAPFSSCSTSSSYLTPRSLWASVLNIALFKHTHTRTLMWTHSDAHSRSLWWLRSPDRDELRQVSIMTLQAGGTWRDMEGRGGTRVCSQPDIYFTDLWRPTMLMSASLILSSWPLKWFIVFFLLAERGQATVPSAALSILFWKFTATVMWLALSCFQIIWYLDFQIDSNALSNPLTKKSVALLGLVDGRFFSKISIFHKFIGMFCYFNF